MMVNTINSNNNNNNINNSINKPPFGFQNSPKNININMSP
jgi:hypothetical protein